MTNKKTRCKSCGINLATMIVRARELSGVECYDPEKLTSLQWKQLQRQTIKGMFEIRYSCQRRKEYQIHEEQRTTTYN